MTPDLIFSQLVKMFPRGFGDLAGIDAWAGQYREALAGIQPDALARAYRTCMADWDRATPPKPGDIRKHLGMPDEAAKGGKLAPTEAAKGHQRRLADDFFLFEAERIARWTAQFDDDHKPIARRHLALWINDLAWREGQKVALGRRAEPIVVSDQDFERLAARVESQARAAGKSGFRNAFAGRQAAPAPPLRDVPGQPAPAKQPADEAMAQ